MNRWGILIIGLLLSVISSTTVSAFLGVHTYAFSAAYLISIISFLGVTPFSLSAGLAAAFFGELFTGMSLGTSMIPFIAVSIILLMLQKTWTVRPLMLGEFGIGTVPAVLLSMVILLSVFFIVVGGVEYVVYQKSLSWRSIIAIFRSWETFVYNMVILSAYIGLFILITKKAAHEVF